MSDHYQDGEKSWEDILEKIYLFFTKHTAITFLLGLGLGFILRPIIIGWLFLIIIICLML